MCSLWSKTDYIKEPIVIKTYHYRLVSDGYKTLVLGSMSLVISEKSVWKFKFLEWEVLDQQG